MGCEQTLSSALRLQGEKRSCSVGFHPEVPAHLLQLLGTLSLISGLQAGVVLKADLRVGFVQLETNQELEVQLLIMKLMETHLVVMFQKRAF